MNRFTVPIAAHVFLLRAGQVLLLLRHNTGFEDGKYGVPAGHLEPGESVRQAAARECREEVGVVVDPADLRPIGATHYTSPSGTGVDFFFVATRWRGEPSACAECSAVVWCAPDSLPETTIVFIRRAIERQLVGGQWFDEDGWA
jgi:8-oxo-dGTP pyrophosphatase MutT (NUDIX family)